MVPHLTTALTGPLLDLEKCLLDNETSVERWLRTQWLDHTPPFYASVDLRNAGYKLAPVDTNLFPAGFNQLSQAARENRPVRTRRRYVGDRRRRWAPARRR